MNIFLLRVWYIEILNICHLILFSCCIRHYHLSHLAYANCVWSPYKQMDIETIERVQMRATTMVQQLNNSSYEVRLRRLNLPTLKCRRLRGYMIQVYNIVSGKHTTNPTLDFNLSNVFNTRGNINIKICFIELKWDSKITKILYDSEMRWILRITVWNGVDLLCLKTLNKLMTSYS